MDDDIFAKLVEKIEADGVITEEELGELEAAAMADGRVTTGEADIVNSIAKKLRADQVRQSEDVYRLSLRIREGGGVTEDDLKQLHAAILSDGRMTHDEQMILTSVVDAMRGGGGREG